MTKPSTTYKYVLFSNVKIYLNVKNAIPVLKYFREITVTDDVSLTCGLQTFVQ